MNPMGFKLVILILISRPLTLQGASWSSELSLGFPDHPALRLSRSLWDQRLAFFVQTSSPFLILIKSELPQRTLSHQETVAIQNEPQNVEFNVRVTSLHVTGVEWFPWQGSWFLQNAYERRLLSIDTAVSLPFRFITAREAEVSHSEMAATVRTRTRQDLLRFATGQRFPIGLRWTMGWYCGFTEVLRTQSQVQATVGLRNRQATLRREASADNLQDALQAQSENLRRLSARELQPIAAQRMPLLGLSFGLRF